MTVDIDKPAGAYLRELKAVAQEASALAQFVTQANQLPDDFPRSPIITLCQALMLTPHGTVEGSINTLTHASTRLPSFRNDYLDLVLDDDDEYAEVDGDGPLRGDRLDKQMSGLYIAVGSAIEGYKKLTGQEIDIDVSPETALPDEYDYGRDEISEKARDLESTSNSLSNEIAKAEVDLGEFGERAQMLLKDAEQGTKTGRSEAELPSPRPTLLERSGASIEKATDGLENIGRNIEAAADITDVGIEWWSSFEERGLKFFTQSLREFGSGLTKVANIIRKRRDKQEKSTNATTPPPDFDLDEAQAMILRGQEPPRAWRPFIDSLSFLVNDSFSNLAPLRNLTGLQTLDLDGTGVNEVSALSGLKGLKRLDLQNTQVSDVNALASLTNLQALCLNNTQVNDQGVEALGSLTNLQWLDLSNTQVSDQGVAALVPLTNLQTLYLNNTQVSDQGVEALVSLTNLQKLSLNNTQVSDQGVEALVSLRNLQTLSLNNTQVSDQGVEALVSLANLQRLNLDNTQVSDQGVEALGSLRNLQTLFLDNTQVSDQGVEALGSLRNLQTLILSNTQLSDQGVETLGSLTNLQWLDLSDSQVGDQGVAALGSLTNLQRLNLDNTQVSEDGIKRLRAALPDCTIIS